MSNLKVEQARKLSIPRLPPSDRFRSSSVTSSTIGTSSLWFGHRKSSANKSDANSDLSSSTMTNPSYVKQQEKHHGSGSSCSNVSKRRHSSFGGGDSGKYTSSGQFKRRKKESGIIPPTKFLLGGNINDPLNLNGLNDGEIGRVINQVTPQTSPMPVPRHHTKVEVLIPPNINDPLNLNAGEDDAELELNLVSPKLKKRSRKKKKSTSIEAAVENVDVKDKSGDDHGDLQDVTLSAPESSAEICNNSSNTKSNSVVKPSTLAIQQSIQSQQLRPKKPDKIVSPVIPQPRSRKRRSSGHTKSNLQEAECDSGNHAERSSSQPTSTKPQRDGSRFRYGNYDRYYGYRNPKLGQEYRLLCFKKEWFEGKDILDIGCNTGIITLSIARDFSPKKIIGLDIDYKLVKRAKKNVFHYLRDDDKDSGNRFPVSLPICRGPITTAAVLKGDTSPKFPNNTFFLQANYVLESDDLLDIQRPEFDVILCLSLTKWVQLNWGDEGLKRLFKRMYKQLRPGGKMILEAQAYSSYGRRKKIVPAMLENYFNIKLKPENFNDYLLSKEVGFSKCEVIGTPYNLSKGFRRPIQMFTKSGASPSNSPVEPSDM